MCAPPLPSRFLALSCCTTAVPFASRGTATLDNVRTCIEPPPCVSVCVCVLPFLSLGRSPHPPLLTPIVVRGGAADAACVWWSAAQGKAVNRIGDIAVATPVRVEWREGAGQKTKGRHACASPARAHRPVPDRVEVWMRSRCGAVTASHVFPTKTQNTPTTTTLMATLVKSARVIAPLPPSAFLSLPLCVHTIFTPVLCTCCKRRLGTRIPCSVISWHRTRGGGCGVPEVVVQPSSGQACRRPPRRRHRPPV